MEQSLPDARKLKVDKAPFKRQALMAAILTRFGGDLNVQSAFYIDGILIVFSAGMGITNVRRTRTHRKWMLREP